MTGRFGSRTSWLLLFAGVSAAGAADIDQDGGITLLVSFEETGAAGAVQPPVDAAGAMAHYCATFEEMSQELWYTTEGTHWLKRVRFMEDLKHRDVWWHYITPGNPASSYASWNGSYILLREPGHPVDQQPSPYQPPRRSAESLGKLLNHEFGHFFYQLPDEYVNFKNFRGGRTGFCSDSYTSGDADTKSTGTVCDEEERQCGINEVCVFKNQCIRGEIPPNWPCEEDDDCGFDGICQGMECVQGEIPPGWSCTKDEKCGFDGICLGTNGERDDKGSSSTKHICDAATNLPDFTDRVCLMRSGSYRRRWCDGGLTYGLLQQQGSTHVYVRPGSGSYGDDTVDFDLGNAPGQPWHWAEAEYKKSGYVGHSCWAEAAKKHVDLKGVHEVGDPYSDIAALGAPPAMDCQWFVDGLGTSSNPLLLVDKSGSMAYADVNNVEVAAVDLAVDAALYFYKQVPLDNFVGVYLFDDVVQPASSLGMTLELKRKVAEIDSIDAVVAGGGTNIAAAIAQGWADFEITPGVPESTRDIVLFSDGKNNAPNSDPYEQAQIACDGGIFVHTIAYGNADSDALEQLAKCGTAWVSGTFDADDIAFDEPDPLEIKSSIARMVHHVNREVELLEAYGQLEPLPVSTVETRTFTVPQGADRLTFSWLGNRTCVDEGPPPSSCLPVLNLLSLELESPTGVPHTASRTTDGDNGVYQTIEIVSPEAGSWTARVDKTEPLPAPSTIAGEWDRKVEQTRVVWTAHVEHSGIEPLAWTEPRRGPLAQPVTILAKLHWGEPLTRISAEATVSHAGQSWVVPLFDDGEHGDRDALDGLYAGSFNGDGTLAGLTSGGYRVKVRMRSDADSLAVVEGEVGPDEVEPPLELSAPRGAVTVEAETSFRLSSRYSTGPSGEPIAGSVDIDSCPDMLQGSTLNGLAATVDGVALDPDDTRIAMGRGVELAIDSLVCPSCGETAGDPTGTIFFDATVELDAPTGPRDVWVQVGREILVAREACRVCAAPGGESCNGIDDDCNGLTDEDASGSQDSDADGVLQLCDNCPFAVNRDQADSDADGEGDRCDVDDGRIHIVATSKERFEWEPEGGHFSWNVYRGDLDVLRTSAVYTQLPGSNPLADRFCGLPTHVHVDSVTPPPGLTAFYLASWVSGALEDGLGDDGAGSPRANDNPCPTGPPM